MKRTRKGDFRNALIAWLIISAIAYAFATALFYYDKNFSDPIAVYVAATTGPVILISFILVLYSDVWICALRGETHERKRQIKILNRAIDENKKAYGPDLSYAEMLEKTRMSVVEGKPLTEQQREFIQQIWEDTRGKELKKFLLIAPVVLIAAMILKAIIAFVS